MRELSLKELQRLQKDSTLLNDEIMKINAILDEANASMDGMCDITGRIKNVFALYRELVIEIQK